MNKVNNELFDNVPSVILSTLGLMKPMVKDMGAYIESEPIAIYLVSLIENAEHSLMKFPLTKDDFVESKHLIVKLQEPLLELRDQLRKKARQQEPKDKCAAGMIDAVCRLYNALVQLIDGCGINSIGSTEFWTRTDPKSKDDMLRGFLRSITGEEPENDETAGEE